MTGLDKVFSGSIPKLYDTHLVPLIFEPYASDLAHFSDNAVFRPLRSFCAPGIRYMSDLRVVW
jgi:hypothetical protein